MEELFRMLSTLIQDPNNPLKLPEGAAGAMSGWGDYFGRDEQARGMSRLNVDTNKDIDPYVTQPFKGYLGYEDGGRAMGYANQLMNLTQGTNYGAPNQAAMPTVFGEDPYQFSMIPTFNEGGWNTGMFEGLYNLGTKRGRRKQKQLERIIKRANKGNENAAAKLQGMQNQAILNNLENQGWDVDLTNKRNQVYTATDPVTGQSRQLDVDTRLGFGNRFWNTGKGGFDLMLSNLGMPDVIQNSFVDRSKFLTGLTGAIGKVAPLALNAAIPGLGAAGSLLGKVGLGTALSALSGPMNAAFQAQGPGQGIPQSGGMFGMPSIPGQLYSPMGSMFDMLTAGGGFGAGMNQPATGGLFRGMLPQGQVQNPTGNTGIGGLLGMFGYEDGGKVDPFSFLRRQVPTADPSQFPAGIRAPKEDPRIQELGMGLLEVESRHTKNPYAAFNKQTKALGKYQFLPRWHRDAILDATDIDVGTKEGREEFMNSPELQEEYFKQYAADTLLPKVAQVRRRYGRALDGYSDPELMAVLHYNWTGGIDEIAKGNLESNPTADSSIANVTYAKYLNKVRKGIRRGKREETMKFETGGPVPLTPIQTERGEMILHPDGAITPVNARKLHRHMDDDEVTDIVPEGSYIFSNSKDIRMDRNEAEGIRLGVEAKPYKEAKMGALPEFHTLASLFGKNKRMTPAEMARTVNKRYKVQDYEGDFGANDMFTLATNKDNMMSRIPYVSEIVKFNEDERTAIDRSIPSFGAGGQVDQYPDGGFADYLPMIVQAVPTITQLFGGNKNDGYANLPGQIDPLSQSLMLGSFPLSSAGITRNIRAQMGALDTGMQDYASLGDSLATAATQSAQAQQQANMGATLANLMGQLGQDFGEDIRYDFSAQRSRLQNMMPRSATRAATEAMSTPNVDIQALARNLGPGGGDTIAQILGQNRAATTQAQLQNNQFLDDFNMNRISQLNQLDMAQQQGNIPLDLQANEARNRQLSNVAGLAGQGIQRSADVETGRLGRLGDIQSQLLPIMTQLNMQKAGLAGQNAIQQGQQMLDLGAMLAAIKNQNQAMTLANPYPEQDPASDLSNLLASFSKKASDQNATQRRTSNLEEMNRLSAPGTLPNLPDLPPSRFPTNSGIMNSPVDPRLISMIQQLGPAAGVATDPNLIGSLIGMPGLGFGG